MLRLVSTLFLLFLPVIARGSSTTPPNVILVITDDQGYGDLSCHGNPILETPNLDRLHAESIHLTNFHVSPTCAPTRGALMSGHCSNRAGTWHTIMGRSLILAGETTLGEAFAAGGYATGMFGKWHLGDNYPYRPEDRGFQEVVRHGGGGVGQTPDYWNNAYFDDTYFHNGKPEQYKGYCTDVFFAEAKRFITQQQAAGKPFFTYISTNAPHSPYHCPPEYSAPYQNKVKQPQEAIFFGMIANLDENVGALREWLDEEGLSENTIFIFMTDNGTANGQRVFNAGMRGQKGSQYEGGHRVPCFIHWPAGGMSKAVDVDNLTAHIDILPTLEELCSLGRRDGYYYEGKSLVPLLRDQDTVWPDRVIITDSQRVLHPIKWRQSSTMSQRWRLIDGKELYEIELDPSQKHDVAQQYPEVVRKLRGDYENWWESLQPTLKKDARIVVGNPAENPTQLTAHDWLVDEGGVPWNQSLIRAGQQNIGHWALHVETAGKYRIALRRWPAKAGASIGEAVPAGKPSPGLEAYRETPGKSLTVTAAHLQIGERKLNKQVQPEDAAAVFETTLPVGDLDLKAYFSLEDDEGDVGAYYVEVERL